MQIPKMKAFISDPDDMRGESWQQSTWDDMIVHVLSQTSRRSLMSRLMAQFCNCIWAAFDIHCHKAYRNIGGKGDVIFF